MLITYLNIRCGNACLPDLRNLCDIVNVGWKRKYIDRRTKRFSIPTKPIFCADEWSVRHEVPNRFTLET